MTRPRFLFLLALVLTASPGRPRAGAGGAAMPKIEFEKFTLPNGLQVILHVDRKLPIVHVNEWFHVGSKNEQPGRTGFAHLFEHMMFQGSKNATGRLLRLRREGRRQPPRRRRQRHHQQRPHELLRDGAVGQPREPALARVRSPGHARRRHDQEKLDNQRDVVKNERRQGLENTPYGRWFTLIFENRLPRRPSVLVAGHRQPGRPHGRVARRREGVLPARTTRRTTSRSSSPATSIRPRPSASSRSTSATSRRARRSTARQRWIADARRREGRRGQRPRARWSASTSPGRRRAYFAPDDAALDIAARILSDGLSSRLNKALVYDKQLATDVASFNATAEISSVFVVRPPRGRACRSRRSSRSSRTRSRGWPRTARPPAELERAKTKQESEFISGLERIGGFGGKADVLNQYNTFLGDPGKFDADLQRYRALTPADVQQRRRDAGSTRRNRADRPLPSREVAARLPNAMTFDRSKMPPLGADRPFTAPDGADGEARQRPRGLRRRASRPAEGRRHARHTRRRGRRSGRQGGRRQPHDGDASTWARRRARRSRSRTRSATSAPTLGGGAGRESAASDVRRAEAQPGAGAGHRRRRRAASRRSRRTSSTREKKRALDALAQADSNGNALAPAHPADARVRRRSSVRAAGRRGCSARVETITRDDLVAFHADALEARHRRRSSSPATSRWPTPPALATKHFGGWSGGAAPHVADPAADAVAGRDASTSSTGRTPRRRSSRSSCRRRRARRRLLRADARRRGVGRRRVRHAAEPQPARGQGLLVRRVLDLQPDAHDRHLVRAAAACRRTRRRNRSSSSTRR